MAESRHPGHEHADHLRHPDGTWKYSNALVRESSPYLLQHAHNPVQWYPWGPEAFALARQSNKPIFLSIGYSTCYWCHVMEREVFENPELAQLMNEHMVNIKVDREERPDVDDIYMLAVQAMTQRGGWPMSVFLTPPGAQGPDDPGLQPFWAGTYIPPTPRQGMPSFPQVVMGLSQAWQQQKPQVLARASQVADVLGQHLSQPQPKTNPSIDLVSAAASSLLRSYDGEYGGFGAAPKFPQPGNLLLLIAVYLENPDQDIWRALAHTLQAMAQGGMFDQIGGGFHRYSTDEKWLVPHFEKMLYDNAQLLEAYLAADQVHQPEEDPLLYQRVIRQTCDYVLREMTDSSGLFWSAQDAEVDAYEGGNYLWTPEEVRQAVHDEQLSELALSLYGLDQGPNFQDPHQADAAPTNVLYLPQPLAQQAREQQLTLDELLQRKARMDGLLMLARNQRRQPGTDDKALTCWNGMMIAALAKAGAQLAQPRYTAAAARAVQAVRDHLRDDQDRLYRSWRQGQARIPAFLEDYAQYAHGLLELHRATGEERYLQEALLRLTQAQERFAADELGGGYFDTLAGQSDLLVRVRSVYDGALPSGNSQMVHNLVDAHQITGKQAYLDQATENLRAFAAAMSERGPAMAHMAHALLRAWKVYPAGLPMLPDLDSSAPASPRRALAVEVQPQVINLAQGPARFTVTLHIHREYHLNAHEVNQQFLVPTSLELQGADGQARLQVNYPPGHNRRFTFADEDLSVYEGDVVLEVTMERQGQTPPATPPKLLLTYQACTDENCLEPRTVAIPLTIEGM